MAFHTVEIDNLQHIMGLGAADAAVALFQADLNRIGFKGANGKRLVEDGLWGANTAFAQQAFQRQKGLPVTGTFSRDTANLANQTKPGTAPFQPPRYTSASDQVKASLPVPVRTQAATTTAVVTGGGAVPPGVTMDSPGFIAKMKDKWAGLSTIQKVGVGVGALALVGGIVVLVRGRSAPAAAPQAAVAGWHRLNAKRTGHRANRRRPRGVHGLGSPKGGTIRTRGNRRRPSRR